MRLLAVLGVGVLLLLGAIAVSGEVVQGLDVLSLRLQDIEGLNRCYQSLASQVVEQGLARPGEDVLTWHLAQLVPRMLERRAAFVPCHQYLSDWLSAYRLQLGLGRESLDYFRQHGRLPLPPFPDTKVIAEPSLGRIQKQFLALIQVVTFADLKKHSLQDVWNVYSQRKDLSEFIALIKALTQLGYCLRHMKIDLGDLPSRSYRQRTHSPLFVDILQGSKLPQALFQSFRSYQVLDLNTPVWDLGFSPRKTKDLLNAGIFTVADWLIAEREDGNDVLGNLMFEGIPQSQLLDYLDVAVRLREQQWPSAEVMDVFVSDVEKLKESLKRNWHLPSSPTSAGSLAKPQGQPRPQPHETIRAHPLLTVRALQVLQQLGVRTFADAESMTLEDFARRLKYQNTQAMIEAIDYLTELGYRPARQAGFERDARGLPALAPFSLQSVSRDWPQPIQEALLEGKALAADTFLWKVGFPVKVIEGRTPRGVFTVADLVHYAGPSLVGEGRKLDRLGLQAFGDLSYRQILHVLHTAMTVGERSCSVPDRQIFKANSR